MPSNEPEVPQDSLGSWAISVSPRGGHDFRVSPRDRGCLVGGAVLLAAGWIGCMVRALVVGGAQPFGVSPGVSAGVGVACIAFAAWVAFGFEFWHVELNCLEHQVGIGQIRHVRRYQDAAIAVTTLWNQYGRPSSRLFVVDAAGRHFMLERLPAEAAAVANFVCRETGWKQVESDPGPGNEPVSAPSA